MSSDVETGRITTDIPARLDRLPWSRWHWMVVIGLGTVWILDGLEVTIVGSMSEALKPEDTGLGLSSRTSASPAPLYVAGACLGALFFGQLTDRFGRKKLFLVTLGVYTVATVATAFAPDPLWYFIARFVTGMGIGGEYAAINSAIDELIPKAYRGPGRHRDQRHVLGGCRSGSLLTIPLLDPDPRRPGARLAARVRAGRGAGDRHPRRPAPRAGEPPLAVHPRPRGRGRDEIVTTIEEEVQRREPAATLPEIERRPDHHPAAPHRSRSPEIASTVFTLYPRRTVSCLSLFVGAGVPLQRLLLHLRRRA